MSGPPAALPEGPRMLMFEDAREVEAIEHTIVAAEARFVQFAAQQSDPGVFKGPADRGPPAPAAGLHAARWD